VIHAVVHVALLGLVSHLCLQVLVLMDPEMPFSKPPSRSGRSATLIIFMMMVGLLAAAFGFLSSWLYRSPSSILVTFAAVLAATVAAESLTRARVRREAQSLEFEG
jgi:Flp pilus assembly protein TadB